MDVSKTNKPFKYVPINELSNVSEEKEKIQSGYYVDINKQLEVLTESYNDKIFEQNPFSIVEHNTTEYLEYLKTFNISANVAFEDIPNVNLEKVFENMSPEDIDAIENILNKSLKGVVDVKQAAEMEEELNPKKIDLNCFKEVEFEFESDNDSVVLVSKFPNYDCFELGAAKTLVNLHRK